MGENRILQAAFGISLLLHLVLAAATWRIPFVPEIDPARAAPADEVELLLVDLDEPSGEPDPDRPTAYTAIPERLASEEPPAQADYLAMHDALAADRKDGDSPTPSADEEWIAPKVAIEREQLDGAGGVTYAPVLLPNRESSGGRAAGDEGEAERRREADRQNGLGEWALPQEEEEAGGENVGEQDDAPPAEQQPDLDWVVGGEPSILKENEEAAVGDRGYDFTQTARGDVGVGMAIDGDFSLNTYEWDYAPWMKRFENELHRHWAAPMAYRMGVIHGMTLIRIVVQRDGTLTDLEVLETDGHDSLHDASAAALKAFAPYAPLPAKFPEENLVITLALHYPAWRH